MEGAETNFSLPGFMHTSPRGARARTVFTLFSLGVRETDGSLISCEGVVLSRPFPVTQLICAEHARDAVRLL